MSRSSPHARINIRTEPRLKDLIERAAMTNGMTVTDYILSVVVRDAKETLDENCVRVLSARDTEAFLTIMEERRKPNAALRTAAARYLSDQPHG